VREAGGFFLDETQLWMLPTVISERFDALIYFDRTTRARPVRPGSS
jgi:hypothetical protein